MKMINKSEKKHDELNESYLKKMRGMERLFNNLEYSNNKQTLVLGELDGFFYKQTDKGYIAYILETKLSTGTKRYFKAIEQMERAEKIFIPQFEREYKINFNKVVHLFCNPDGISCQKVSYRR